MLQTADAPTGQAKDIPILSWLPRLSLPDRSLFETLWLGALGIALMSFVESIASARAFTAHDDSPVDADRELFALGLANLAGAFTFAGVVVMGTLQGITVAVLISIAVLMYLANHPPVYIVGRKRGADMFRPLADHPDDEAFPGLLMLRSEGILYSASAPRAIERYWAAIRRDEPRVVVVECSAIPNRSSSVISM